MRAMFIMLLLVSPALGQTTGPLIQIEVNAAAEPLSVYCTPSGEGDVFSAARTPTGAVGDATLAVRLTDADALPIPFYPAEDIWLASSGDDFASCNGGVIADANTDADGRTQFHQPLMAGGQLDAAAGDVLLVLVNAEVLDGSAVSQLSFNSADLNGDLSVNMSDVVAFAQEYLAGGSYRTDLKRDGVSNLSDVVRFAGALGSDCP